MPTIRSFTTAAAPPELLLEIRQLLVEAFGVDFSKEDWEHTLGGRHVVVVDGSLVLAHAAVVPRTLEVAERPFRAGYVEGVATAPGKQQRGLGSLAMAQASRLVRAEFDMGALSTDRHEFYERLGWERWLGPSFVRRGLEVIRTADEDEGLMVLRFGPSENLDLTTSLTCEGRRGDDW